MTGPDVSDALGLLDDELIEDAEHARRKTKRAAKRKHWGVAAACLCVIAVGAVSMLLSNGAARPVLQWSVGFDAADYFSYNKTKDFNVDSSKSIADHALPYVAQRNFSDDRALLEAEGAIPQMENHPLFNCVAGYNEDGSIYSVTLSWHCRDGEKLEYYSDLTITAGYQEVEMIEDCCVVEVDENGNIVPDAVTVTERDGVQIIAEGNENRNKTLTFQNEHGWYQIEGSWNDSYEDVVYLLDWIWEHPLDFSRFAMENGDTLEGSNLDEMPYAFQAYIPDFEAFGYVRNENYVTLKNGEPYRFEGHWLKDNVEQGVGAEVEIHWCIDTDPDYYDRQEILGELTELTEGMIRDTLEKSSNVAFMWDGCFIKVYTKSAQELWTMLESLSK